MQVNSLIEDNQGTGKLIKVSNFQALIDVNYKQISNYLETIKQAKAAQVKPLLPPATLKS